MSSVYRKSVKLLSNCDCVQDKRGREKCIVATVGHKMSLRLNVLDVWNHLHLCDSGSHSAFEVTTRSATRLRHNCNLVRHHHFLGGLISISLLLRLRVSSGNIKGNICQLYKRISKGTMHTSNDSNVSIKNKNKKTTRCPNFVVFLGHFSHHLQYKRYNANNL